MTSWEVVTRSLVMALRYPRGSLQDPFVCYSLVAKQMRHIEKNSGRCFVLTVVLPAETTQLLAHSGSTVGTPYPRWDC
jgi:hypothetical protein